MRRFMTVLAAAALSIALLAAGAAAQESYPIDVRPLIVERDSGQPSVLPGSAVEAPAVAAPRPVPAQGLASTGLELTVGLALALGLLTAGGLAVWRARRRPA